MKNLTVIPARCGSKRIPGKNIKLLGGKPLIAYSIEYALNNKEWAGDIVVSTDCPEIASAAGQFDITIHNRPKELAGDQVSTAEVLQNLVIHMNRTYDFVVLLQPTNPFRPGKLIENAFERLIESKKKSLFTVSPLIKKLGKVHNDRFVPVNYQFGQRSQDIETLYYENGLLYISSYEMIISGKIMDEDSLAFTINHIFATVDIDTEEDWLYAEFVLNRIRHENT